MTSYNVEIELALRENTEEITDEIIDRYEGLSAVVSTSMRGWLSVIVSVDTKTLQQAITIALGLTAWPVVTVHGMTSKEFDRRVERDIMELPELMSIPEVAAKLGTSRQAVHQRIESGSLPARRVGRAWVVPVTAL